MRTLPIEPEEFTSEHNVKLATLARNIDLPGPSVQALLAAHGYDHAPVLIQVLQLFQDGFVWAKAGALLHSDKEMALDMIQKVASDLGQTLPAKPMLESHST